MLKILELKDTVLKCNMIHRKTINIFNISIKYVYSWSLLLTYFVAFLNNCMPTVRPDSALFCRRFLFYLIRVQKG
jgi:hypothetical protein